MQNIVDNEYFFWGSAYPDQYGLYSPSLDRFILVDSTDHVIEFVCFLLSSKINLQILPLHKTDNFLPTLIDNSCCIQWGVQDWHGKSPRLTPRLFSVRESYFLNDCRTLGQRSPAPDHVQDLQRLALLAAHVVKFFRFGPYVMYTKFYGLVSTPFGFPNFDLVKAQEKQCFDLLFLSQDYEIVNQQIKDILAACLLSQSVYD
jgi:hypothetical protein